MRKQSYSKNTRSCGENDIPYYPIRLTKEKTLLGKYVDMASQEKNISFIGRLGTYRYLDMHVTIAEALDTSEQYIECQKSKDSMPPFNKELL
jgi:UDP-galactopyranose mutase